MDVAVYFQKINYGSIFIFKPINVMRGTYDKENDTFMSEGGVICYPIDGEYMEDEDYFFSPTNIKELKKSFGEDIPEETIIENFFNIFTNSLYVGMYSEDDDKIKIHEIDFDEIQDAIEGNIYEESLVEDKQRFMFTLDGINELKNMKSINEVRSKLDKIINNDQSTQERIEQYDITTDLQLEWNEEDPYSILGIKEGDYSKEDLLNIVEKRIKFIYQFEQDKVKIRECTDKILDAYNDITKEYKKTFYRK